jgi:hypothetical protein
MPTVVNTGQSLSLTVGGTSRSAQVTNAQLMPAPSRTRFVLIGGTETQVVVDTAYTLSCEVLLDWDSAVTGWAETLWNAYVAAPNTAIAFVLTINGNTFTSTLYPEMPPAGGASDAAHTWSATFQVAGTPTLA